ncbi:MAG: ATP-binding protein [Gemmatimonas sp.]
MPTMDTAACDEAPALGRRAALGFLHSRTGKSFLGFVVLCLLLSMAVGFGFYRSSVRWFQTTTGQQASVVLGLVDAFVATYSKERSGDSAIPSTFRAHAIARYNRGRSSDDAFQLDWVGVAGRQIATAPSDPLTAEVLRRFSRVPDPAPETALVRIGDETLLRAIYPSIANHQSCVDCHNQYAQGRWEWKLGDVLGAFVVSIRADAFLRRATFESLAIGAFVFASSAGIGLFFSWSQYLYMVRRSAVETRIRASEQRIQDYADTASDWYWQTGSDHACTYVSDRIRAFNISPEQWLGKTPPDIATDVRENVAGWRAHLEAIERHEPFRDFTFRTTHDDGSVCFVTVSGKAYFSDSGVFLGYRGSARDVTAAILADQELRQAKMEAELANISKSQFLATMSHELRTPLNAILGFSELIAQQSLGAVGHPKYRDYAQDIHDSGQHLLAIINDILDMSKIEAGQLTLREDVIDVATVAETCRRFIQQRADDAGVMVATDVVAGLPGLRGDELRVKQVVLNLLSNAVKFTPRGGHVTLSAGIHALGGIAVTVTDTGIGMSPEEIDIALKAFHQVDNSLQRSHEGTGLGLPLAKNLVELHGGRLIVDSTPGAGTKVSAVFPATRLHRPPAASARIA